MYSSCGSPTSVSSGYIDKIVNGVNAKRHAEVGAEKYIDLSQYGADRSEQAKKQRDNADNKKGAKASDFSV